jgi:hypothetical protein
MIQSGVKGLAGILKIMAQTAETIGIHGAGLSTSVH